MKTLLPHNKMFIVLALALPTLPALAIERAEIEARYQADRQACMRIADAEERRSCLRDAGAVRQEALRGQIVADPDAEVLRRNAVQRCQVHRDQLERTMCERMALGEGEVSGSVEGGGLIRQLEVEIDPTSGAVRR
jgi:hypothetical protein